MSLADPQKMGVYRICKHLFRKFLTDKDIDTGTAADKAVLYSKLDIDEAAVELFNELMSEPISFAGFMSSWWPVISIIEPPLRHPPEIAQVSVTIKYEGREDAAVNIAIPVIPQEGQPFTTGSALTALRINFNAILDGIIARGGLDGIYKAHGSVKLGETREEAVKCKSPLRGGPGF